MAKKPGMDVMVAVAPHRGGKGGPPDLSAPGPLDHAMGGDEQGEGEPDGDESGITPDEVDYSDSDLCGSCAHNQDGTCAKYGFPVQDTGHCEAGFEPQHGSGAEDAGMGGPGGRPPGAPGAFGQ